jgi:hypothetical protein
MTFRVKLDFPCVSHRALANIMRAAKRKDGTYVKLSEDSVSL